MSAGHRAPILQSRHLEFFSCEVQLCPKSLSLRFQSESKVLYAPR
ncbi:mCG147730 [Mus musculus]|nr:mCG147730 [Mus musculus]